MHVNALYRLTSARSLCRKSRGCYSPFDMMLHDPVARVGPLQVHPFGLTVAIGLTLGFALAYWRAARAGLPLRYFPGTFLVVVLGSFMFARLAYVALHGAILSEGLQGLLSIWHGGFNLIAGVIAGAGLLAILTWARRESFWQWADATAPAASLGLAASMLGLPGGGEGWGMPTTSPVYMYVDLDRRPVELINFSRFHPIFAYEAGLFVALTAVLLVLSWRQRAAGSAGNGTVGLTFLAVTAIGYGALRPLTLDASTVALVLRTQALCAVAAALAAMMLALRFWRARRDMAMSREIAYTLAATAERQKRFSRLRRGVRHQPETDTAAHSSTDTQGG